MIFFPCRRHSTIPAVPFKRLLSATHFRSISYSKDTLLLDDPCRETDSHFTKTFCSEALKLAAERGLLPHAKQLHSYLLKKGSINVLSLQNQLLNVYVKYDNFSAAHKLLDEMPVRNIVSWNTVICGMAGRGGSNCDLNLGMFFYCFRRMLLEGMKPDSLTLNGLLRACLELSNLRSGSIAHGFAVRLGYNWSNFVGSVLVDLYAKCGLVGCASCAFDEIVMKDLVSWNVMLSCFAYNASTEETFNVFRSMQSEDIEGDEFTFTSLLSSCGVTGFAGLGKQLHGAVIKQSFDSDILVASTIVDMYAKSEELCDARKAFDGMDSRNLVSWNTMIVGYGQNGEGKEAMKLLGMMMFQYHIIPDELTLASILSSCGNLSVINEVQQIHCYVVKAGLEAYLSIANSLIVAYSKCGSITNASRSFMLVNDPNLITWTSILSAYGFHGCARKSYQIFEMMLRSGIRPDRLAFLGVLSACSHAGAVKEGLYYYQLMVNEYQIEPDSELMGCLIDLLGRAGLLNEASTILTSVPIDLLDSNMLGALLGACKIRGDVGLAERVAKMLFEIEPNSSVIYTAMSNMYSFSGNWFNAGKTRRIMKDVCNHKHPGCSWIEDSGTFHTFRSGDKSHPLVKDIHAMISILVTVMKDDCDYGILVLG